MQPGESAPPTPQSLTREEIEYRVGVLDIGPEDILIIRLDHIPEPEEFMQIHRAFSHFLPNQKMLILDSRIDLTVMTKGEIEMRTNPGNVVNFKPEEGTVLDDDKPSQV